jgi:hypothetical protein
METPQPPQVSISGRILIEGQLPASGASPENPPPPPSPPWWRFWGDPEALTAKATLLLALGTVALAFFTRQALLVTHADNKAIIAEARTTATQQHNDTLAALAKTDSTIAALNAQANVMRGQLNEMDIARRPWVTANIAPTDQITTQDGSISISTLITLRNTGQTPAIRTNIHGEGFPIMTMITNHWTESERVCETADKGVKMNMTTSPTVFPGEIKLPLKYTFQVPKDKIDDYNKHFAGMNGMIHLALLICLSYTEYGNAPIHHTSFAFRFLGIRITDLPIPSNKFIPVDAPFLTLPPD